MGLHWASASRWYSTAVRSVCAYQASLKPPSVELRRAEADAVARVLHIPNGPIPMATMEHLKDYGVTHNITSITHISTAARARVYASSTIAHQLYQHYHQHKYPNHDDALVQPPYKQWHDTATITQIQHAHFHIHHITGISYNREHHDIQHNKLEAILQDTPDTPFLNTVQQ